jgi:hypothetical protein
MNNIDIATTKLRELQAMIFDNAASNNDLFAKTEAIIQVMGKASKEINTNYETISKQLTDQLNTGKPQ